MIGWLRGEVAALAESHLLLNVNGVGYVLEAGGRTLARLSVGAAVSLWVETKVTQDSIRLFGFLSDEERAWFERLQTIPGVGPRAALSVLDVLAPDALLEAVALEDKAAVARAHGVGPKLALRIVQELKGKAPPKGYFGTFEPAPLRNPASNAQDAPEADRMAGVSALVNLGYPAADARAAIAAALRAEGAGAALDVLIRRALQELAS